VTKAIDALLCAVVGGGAGYLLSKTMLSPAIQDLGAGVGGLGSGVALLLVRSLHFLATATREQGIAAVGFDPRRNAFVALGALGVLSVAVHFLFPGLAGSAGPLPQLIRPAIIGALAGAVAGWVFRDGYWQAG
jgi:hypothetical protein